MLVSLLQNLYCLNRAFLDTVNCYMSLKISQVNVLKTELVLVNHTVNFELECTWVFEKFLLVEKPIS